MQTLSHYGWLGIMPWGSHLPDASSMGGVRQCCSSLCDSDECCMQGKFVSLKGEEACSFWWPAIEDTQHRDLSMVDAIWKWVEEHTCVDRSKAGLIVIRQILTSQPAYCTGKVFASGFSMGGTSVLNLACERSQYLRAAAPIEPWIQPQQNIACSSSRPEAVSRFSETESLEALASSSMPARPVSLLAFGGTGDDNVDLQKLDDEVDRRARAAACQKRAVEQLSATAARQDKPGFPS